MKRCRASPARIIDRGRANIAVRVGGCASIVGAGILLQRLG
jgi:hypothetical protein